MSTELSPSEKQRLHNEIAERLVQIEKLFKPGLMQLTFIARNQHNPKGHILVTSEDNIGDAVKAISELMDQTDATVFPAK